MPPDDTILPGGAGTPGPVPGASFADDAPGTQVGPYKLVSLLGEGGFGAVWLAERRHPFVQRVALKIVKAGMDSKAVVARFEQERQALAVMNHPHVAKVLDGGLTSRGRPYFAMEYVNGEPISDFCDRQKLPLKERLSLFLQVCEAVQHAHTKGIIHRDLKPSNVLVSMGTDDRPSAKVIDFGIAKAVSGRMTEQTLFTETGQMMGTPEYMSPEQADPGAVDIDTRTDVYSLGVILYELLTGVLPFDPVDLRSRAYREIQRVIREEDPPTPSARLSTIATKDAELATRIGQSRKEAIGSLASLLKSELEWIPLKAMRKERQERYDSPADLARDVANYLEGRPLVAAPESTAYRVRKYVRRNRGFVAAATAVVAALVVGLLATFWQYRAADRARAEAVASKDAAVASEARALSQLERSNDLVGVIAAGRALDAVRRKDFIGAHREMPLLRDAKRDGRFAGRLAGAWSDQSIGEPLRGHEWAVSGVALSPDGKTLASGSQDYTIRLWDVSTGKLLGEPLRGHEYGVNCVAFSPDGKMLASGSEDETIRLWDVATRKPLGEPLRGHKDDVHCVAFSPDGKTLASGSEDETICLWDVSTGQALGEPLRGHEAGINAVAFSPDGKALASGSGDETIRLWAVAVGRPLVEPILGHEGAVQGVSFSPDGLSFVSGGSDGTIRVWDAATGKPLGEPLCGHERSITSVVFGPDGGTVVSGSEDKTIRRWDPVMARLLSGGLPGYRISIGGLAFGPDGKTLASGSGKGIQLWDVPTGKPLGAALLGHEAGVRHIAWSPDGKVLASASNDRTLRLWDVVTGEPLCEPLRGHGMDVTGVAFSPDGKTLASGSGDETIRLWDVSTGKSLGAPLRGHEAWINAVAFSPDGKVLASASNDWTLRLWDVATRKPLGEPLRGHKDCVTGVAFSPDGTTLASGSDDNTVRLWDASTGLPLGEPLQGHEDSVLDLAFSPDGKTLVSAGRDGMTRLWDTPTRKQIGEPLRGHDGGVVAVCFSPDGRTLASAGFDALIFLWRGVPACEQVSLYRNQMVQVNLVRSLLARRIAAVGESIESVRAFAAEVRADPRFQGDLRTAALIVVGEVALEREAKRNPAESGEK